MFRLDKVKCKKAQILASIMVILMVCLFLVPSFDVKARDSFVAQYIQTIFNQKNGIGSNEVNCLYQSSTGYVWVGTDGGLYRTNGSGFKSINLWDTERTDVYAINSIMQDSHGRMWIGTDNYGLFYIEDGKNYHLQQEYYDGIKSILDVVETEDGNIFVATSNGLCKLQAGEEDRPFMLVPCDNEQAAAIEFQELVAKGNDVWGIAGNRDIYVLHSDESLKHINGADIVGDDITCIRLIDNAIYIGTAGREVVAFKDETHHSNYVAGVDGINSFMQDQDGRILICADNGLGYFDEKHAFVRINDCEIDTYISDAIQDYEGNYWIASSRMGLLLLTKSKFVDFNMATGMQKEMVNTVFMHRGLQYVGTDSGLIILNTKYETQTNELTEMLDGISIRQINSDKEGNLWIATYRKYGVVKVDPNGNIQTFDRNNGMTSLAIQCVLPLSNGNVAIGTEDGVAIIDANGNEIKTYALGTPLSEVSVLCLYQLENGNIFVGTDGEGIYCINEKEIVEHYDVESGLNSNVIQCFEKGNQGLWVGTDSGMCFYNEAFRSISNMEYSNSIYDVIIQDDVMWIIGSIGVLHTTEEELLGSNGIANRYYATGDGLLKTVNNISTTCIDLDGNLYICCIDGISTLNTKNIPYNLVQPRLRVSAIDIDGETYEFDDLDDGLKIKSDTSRITIDFALFTYQNRSNITVEYSLLGFDEEPIRITGDDGLQAVYTNLDGGVYEFTVNAYNSDGTACEEPISFTIEKEKSLFESPVARIIILVVILLGFILLVFVILRVLRLLRSKTKALEELSKEHEETVKSSSAKNDYLANMSNEIKTPINAMMAKADELLRVVGEDQAYREDIKGIYDIGNDILSRVDDIILLAKLEAGKAEVEEHNYYISSLVAELSNIATEALQDKGVKFFVEFGDHVSDALIGDEEKLKGILTRLLDNAIRYTKQGSITLSVDSYEMAEKGKQDQVTLEFTISDTGIGIQEDRLEHIFEVYNIADNRKSSTKSGNGVGLAIAKGYADLLEAELTAESSYGAGSTFILSIDQKLAVKLSSGQVVNKIEDTVSKEAAEKLWLPDVHALLVDDNEVSVEVSKKILSGFEMKLDVASSGLSAIDMVLNHEYDVVFMDLSMPIMNGTEAMQEIRELAGMEYSVLPIIALDSDAIEGNKADHLAAGFTDSMVKPMEARRVAAILKDCLPGDKLQERSDDIKILIEGSRFREGLTKMMPYMDVEDAIKRMGGSIDVYNRLLTAFYNQNVNAREDLENKLKRDLRGLKTKLHSIRTICNNIGAHDFAKEAFSLETSIGVGKRDQLKSDLRDFVDQLMNYLLVIEDYLKFAEEVSGMTDEEYAEKIAREKEEAEKAETEGKHEDRADDKAEADGVGAGELNGDEAGDVANSAEADKDVPIGPMLSKEALEDIRIYALDGEFEEVSLMIQDLEKNGANGDDAEFLAVLKEAVANENIETIQELITTYIDLKV